MLSFDITDRDIRVVKGTESNGKIRISSAATLGIEEGLIVNGHVKDVPNVATLINGVLKKNKMPDKEAIVSISSNLTIFREMTVTKVKNMDLQKTVKLQMQSELNLDDTYGVSYIIVGDAEPGEGGDPAYKVLATACPYEIVNSYREVFKLLGISLKSVMIGCNCITKVLLADTKIRAKMPLLAVQIDNNFISLNLYEQGQLAFSRFASISAEDYGNSEDYVFEAVNENIFRMLQFQRSRGTGEQIENVIFYGDTHEYVRLTDELEKLDLKTSLINVPPQIHGHENLEFSLYANAIGAMFKRNRETEKINLLETDLASTLKRSVKSGGSSSAGDIVMLGTIAVAAIAVGVVWGVQSIRSKAIQHDIDKIQEFIDSKDTKDKLKKQELLLTMKDKTNTYYTTVNNAYDAFESQPAFNGSQWDAMAVKMMAEFQSHDVEPTKITIGGYSNGQFTVDVECDETDKEGKYTQELPADLADALMTIPMSSSDSRPMFSEVTYTGYTVEAAQTETVQTVDEEGNIVEQTIGDDAKDQVKFTMNITMTGKNSPVELTTEEAAEEAAE